MKKKIQSDVQEQIRHTEDRKREFERIAKEKLSKAKVWLLSEHPFFGVIAMQTDIKTNWRLPTKTLRSTKKLIEYDPEFVAKLDIKEVQACLIHEIMHIALKHTLRINGRELKRWNRAADRTINEIIDDEVKGAVLPENALRHPTNKKCSVEENYVNEPELPENNNGGDGSSDDDDNDDQQQDSNGPPSFDSCAENFGDIGESDEPPTVEEQETLDQDINNMVTMAAQAAQMAGNLPAALQRLIDKIINPRFDLVSWLYQKMNEVEHEDYNWGRPDKKLFAATGMYLPTLHNQALSDVVFVVDTSGSIDQAMIEKCLACINGVKVSYPCRVTVVYCDAAVNKVEIFEKDDVIVNFEPVGGGGTLFQPAFDWIEQNLEKPPVAAIYLTDMYASDRPKMPDYPVLFASVGFNGEEIPWGWGDHIKMEEQ